MPKDIVCGMNVSEASAKKSKYKGKKYFFCSNACKSNFDRNQQKYV